MKACQNVKKQYNTEQNNNSTIQNNAIQYNTVQKINEIKNVKKQYN